MFKLSKFHRYGIALLALIVVVAFWPASEKSPAILFKTSLSLSHHLLPLRLCLNHYYTADTRAVPAPEDNSLFYLLSRIPEPIEPEPNEPTTVTSPEKTPEASPFC